MLKIIRFFNGYEVCIENSVTRVTVWHQGARRVIPNSYNILSDGTFNPHLTAIMPGAVARSEASSLGMQAAPSSIPHVQHILSWRLGH